MKAVNLRTEYLKNPIGIDIKAPRLMWNCQGGVKQTAYRIVTDSWDSGKVESDSMRAVYPERLHSRQRVVWKICLWDEKGETDGWSQASFEMGLLRKEDWQGHWITGNYRVNKKRRYPVDCFRKTLEVSKDIRRARLYVTACGLYEARLNDRKAGDFCLAPGYTDYNRRVQYQSYDVANLLLQGENELTIQLADGWYRGSIGAWGRKNQFGTVTKLLAQLEVEYTDGTGSTIVTDESWAWSNDGPIRFADNKDGEIVEAFRVPLYGGRAKRTSHKVVPSASNNVPVTEHERFTPKRITTPSCRTVLDFGQNIAGYVEFRIRAQAGQRIFLRFGEMLDGDGEFTQKNIQCTNKRITTPLQQVDYLCRQGENHYKTTFAVFGFQYILVETEIAFAPEDFTAIAVYSDMEQTGFFRSSNVLLNRFFTATVWSAKGNHLDIPTDCPTRERHGWTGDAQIFFTTAAYLFDFAAFSKKYLADVYDWQKESGRLPQIAPHGGVDFYMNVMDGSVGWSDLGVLYPYRFWKMYGDRSILAEYYDRMKKYAEFMISRCGRWGGPYAKPTGVAGREKKYLVNCGQSYDEWAEPADVYAFNWTHFAAPHPEVSTAYTSYVMGLMAEIAEALGKTEDIPLYREYCEGCRKAYQALVKQPAFSLDTHRQARLARPLFMGLLDEEQTEYARRRLMKALEDYGWRLGTGFLSTPLILHVLTDMDVEAAYRLLENERLPGWLSMPRAGATTIWEGWEGPEAKLGISSLNHYSKGAVCEWLFQTMCGIRIDGENHFTIAPRPGGSFAYAEASYRSVYGEVKSGWKREDSRIVYTITIPANCTATVMLPGRAPESVAAGSIRREG